MPFSTSTGLLTAVFAALYLVPFARADYTNFFFNSSNGCPGVGISCAPPLNMCAYDSVSDKYYCCSGENYDICRAFAPACRGTNGAPSSSQQLCTTGDASWCCLGQAQERCTSRTGKRGTSRLGHGKVVRADGLSIRPDQYLRRNAEQSDRRCF